MGRTHRERTHGDPASEARATPRPRATLRGRIILAFLAVGLVTAGLGGFALKGIDLTGRLVVATYDNALMSISYARAAASNFTALQAMEARGRLAAGQRADVIARFDALVDDLRGNLEVAADRAQSDASRLAARQAVDAVEAWLALAAIPPPDEGDILERWQGLDAAAAVAEEAFEVLVNLAAGDGFQHRRRAIDAVADTHDATLAATLVALMLGLGIAVLLSRRIIGPIASASHAAREIAAGNLDTAIPNAGRDELGLLLGAMTVMRDNIRAMVNREVAERQSAQARLADAIGTSRDGFVLLDAEERIAVANAQVAAFFPAIADALTPGTAVAAIDGAIARRLSGADAADDGGADEMCLPDGRWLRVSRSVTQEGGSITTFTDITPLKRHEAALRETNFRFEAALNNMSQGLCMYDRENVLQVVNRSFCEIYRVDPAVITPGVTFRDVIAASVAAGNHAATDVEALVQRRLAFVSRREAATAFQELADGRIIAISHEPMTDGGWVVTYEDITERRRAEAQITHMARHDGLTGLSNRAHLREKIEAALAAHMRFAVLSIDLDDFRAVNETHGFPAGDAVLREAATRIAAVTGEGGLVARLGGDEFAVVHMPLTDPEAAALLATRIIAALSEPSSIGTAQVALGASVGIAMAPGDGDNTDALLRHADLARDLARREGRGSFRFFEPGMDARQQKRRLLEADLRHALANGEFLLNYQPLVAIATGQVTGFEALLRWRHPRRGLVSPAEFIPLAEQLDLIAPIGAWVLARACADAAAFPGTPRVAVNVSPLQFRRPGLVEAAAEALATSGLAPDRLELEITESVLLDNGEATRETLHRLRALGLRIAMDDFGTGYSSLQTLRSFPFDKIKIDQSFIRDLGISPDARSIVNAIAGLGRALDMSTTAEGVETEDQLACLAQEGCTEAQGYLFSRPRPAEEIPALLRTLEARRKARQECEALPAGEGGGGQAAA